MSDKTHMALDDVNTILQLNVPVIVRIGHRRMPVGEVLNLSPGSIIELTKNFDEPLDLMVNNRQIGQGTAVKVGEYFGLKVSAVGDAEDRIRALGPESEDSVDAEPTAE